MAEPSVKRTSTVSMMGIGWEKINADPATFSCRGRTLLTGAPANVAGVIVFVGVPMALAATVVFKFPRVVAGAVFGGLAGASFSTGVAIKKDAEGTVVSTRDIRMPLVARTFFPVAMGALAFTAPSGPMLAAAAACGVYGYFTGNTYRDLEQDGKTREWSVSKTPLSEKSE